jgi:hypothetical protein
MVETFGSLGIPFPLFEAPVEEAVEYCGSSTCSVCSRSAAHCFILDIGCALVVPCPSCSIPNGLDAHDHRDQACVACGETLPFPELGDGAIHICYGCLREGHGAITTDTELGMISWEQVQAGHTHGLPGLARADFEMVPLEGGWVGAKLPRDMMLELLRTPNYLTIQGERWQFCCKGPWCTSAVGRRANPPNARLRVTSRNTSSAWCRTPPPIHGKTFGTRASAFTFSGAGNAAVSPPTGTLTND